MFIIRTVEGWSRSVIQIYEFDQKGRRLSGKTGVEQVSFKVFRKGCDRGAIFFIWKGKEFQGTWT